MTEKDIIVGLDSIAAKYGYGKGTEPFTNDEWNTIFRAKETIKHLVAENQQLREEVAEQKSIAAHEHATQMEWFEVACDYKAENAALQKRLDNTVELPRVECIKTWEWLNRERLGDIMLEWCVLYKKGGWLVVEPCLSKEAAEAWLEEIKESNSDGEGEDMSSRGWFTS